MDILYIVPYVPNLIRVRPYNLIRYLSTRGHRLTVMTLWSNQQEHDDVEALKAVCHRVYASQLPTWRSIYNCITALPTKTPLQANYCWHPTFANQISTMGTRSNGHNNFDIIHVEHLRGARYGLYLKQHTFSLRKTNSYQPIVWDSVDCISHLFRQASQQSKQSFNRLLTQFELVRTQQYEAWLVSQFDRILVTSSCDKQAFTSLADPTNISHPISVLPNGVDLEYFQPVEDNQRQEKTLVISGKMSYHANVAMTLYLLQDIMPRVWASHPDVKVWVVGKDPPREITAHGGHPGITVTGTVNDIRPHLQQATVAVAPLTYGAGIQNKVLEAMACATPVVATPQAVSALDVQPGRDIVVAQEPDEFADSVIKLLDDSQCRSQIGRDGRKYIENHHDWSTIAAQLETIYQEAIHSKQ